MMKIKSFLAVFLMIFMSSVSAADKFDYKNFEFDKPVQVEQKFSLEESKKILKCQFTPDIFEQRHKDMLFFQKTGSNTFFIPFPPLDLEDDNIFGDVIKELDKLPKEQKQRKMQAEKVGGKKVVRSSYYAFEDNAYYLINTSYYFVQDDLNVLLTFVKKQIPEKFVKPKEEPKKLLVLKEKEKDEKEKLDKEKTDAFNKFFIDAEIYHKKQLKNK